MSPRHRGRGRHGGAASGAGGGAASNGSGGPAVLGEPIESASEATIPQLAPLGPQPDVAAVGSWNGVANQNGNRPNGGGSSTGQLAGPRRQPRTRTPGRQFGPVSAPAPAAATITFAPAEADQDGVPIPGRRPNCTLAQMRRFIKSRPYVPVHELRRRFEIEGIEDEVSPVATDHGMIYVGLPPEQAQFLGDLIRAGEVGAEMLLDPDSPGVVGVFPMRPVARQ